mmetsp:Transcript_3326/g.7397  ORF Transcript_3326/g.7397 Transcript_3326/m.7397 type:complete len:238 (+) Transcript_3326:530-1243(+)
MLAGSVICRTISGLLSISLIWGLASSACRMRGSAFIMLSSAPGWLIMFCIIRCIEGSWRMRDMFSMFGGCPPTPPNPPPMPPNMPPRPPLPAPPPPPPAPWRPPAAVAPPVPPPPPPLLAAQGFGKGPPAPPPWLWFWRLRKGFPPAPPPPVPPPPAPLSLPVVPVLPAPSFLWLLLFAFMRGSCTFSYILRSMLNPSGWLSKLLIALSVVRICSRIKLGFRAISMVCRMISGSLMM